MRKEFDDVKYDGQGCADLFQAQSPDLVSVLTVAVAKYGAQVLLDPAALGRAMEEAGAPAPEIFRVQLMTQAPGFRELVARESGTLQSDLERFLRGASEHTGFTPDTVLRLTHGILSALGVDWEPPPPGRTAGSIPPQAVTILSAAAYEVPLRQFQAELARLSSGGQAVLDFDSLEPLVNAGIPRAKYCLGYCLLHGVQLPAQPERGLALLEEAANLGDSQAAGELGDYYCAASGRGHWSRAYGYYTGPGAAALTPARQAALRDILNQKLFNRRFLVLCALLLAVFAATVFFPPAAALYPPHRILGAVSLLAQAGVLGWAVLRFRADPYELLCHVPVLMAGIWSVYMAGRIFL